MIKGFATVTLWVKDFKESIHFYHDILGLELRSNPGEVPQFSVGDGYLVLVKGNFCPPADAFPPEFPQLGLETDNLDMMAARLHNSGVELAGNIEERRDSRWIKVCDPDGNLLEIVEVKR